MRLMRQRIRIGSRLLNLEWSALSAELLHCCSFLHHLRTKCLWQYHMLGLQQRIFPQGWGLRLSLSTYETTASGTKTCLNCNDKCTKFPGTVCYSCSMGFYPLGLACHKCSENSMACNNTSACNTCATGTPLREDSACLVELEILVPCRWTVLSCCTRSDVTLARSAPLSLAVL